MQMDLYTVQNTLSVISLANLEILTPKPYTLSVIFFS